MLTVAGFSGMPVEYVLYGAPVEMLVRETLELLR